MTASIANISAVGMLRAQQSFETSAAKALEQINAPNSDSPNPNSPDIVTHFVEQIQSRNAFQANHAVAKAKDEILGSFLDIIT